MPPKKTQSKTTLTKSITLKKVLDGIENLPNADGSKRIWRNNLIQLVATWKNVDDELTNEEIAEKMKDIDVMPVIKDFDLFCDIVENKIVNKVTGVAISLETRKQYFIAILPLIGCNGVINLDEETLKKYTSKKVEYEKVSHEVRKLNIPKGAVAKFSEMTWDVFKEQYHKFIDERISAETVPKQGKI
jgi:hypothetical protein